jgi:hypothetical protein
VLVSGGEKKVGSYVPLVAVIDGAFRDAFFLLLDGLIVSLLAFVRNVPPCSARDDTRSDGAPIVFCATELTISVSTVMLRVAGSGAPVFCRRLLYDARDEGALGRGVVSGSVSCGFFVSSFFSPPSLSEFEVFLVLCLLAGGAIDRRGVDEPDDIFSSGMSKYFWLGSLLQHKPHISIHPILLPHVQNDSPTYLEKTFKSFPGVFGPLVSCTVSNVGAPLTPLLVLAVFASCAVDVLSSCSSS